MANNVFPQSLGMFNDVVFTATELNRNNSAVLNQARKRPVTISRNNEQFALMMRDQAASLVRAVVCFQETIEVLRGAVVAIRGETPNPAVAWLSAFDKEDLSTFLDELLPVAERASTIADSEGWDEVDAIIHEWHETALAIRSGTLEEALSSRQETEALPVSTLQNR